MPRFVLFFFVLWVAAAAVVFSNDGFALRTCLESRSAATCYAAFN